jgi:hypothetical protein
MPAVGYQRMVLVDENGNSEQPTYAVSVNATAHVAAARTTLFDLFNATGSGKLLLVRQLFIMPSIVAVTGVGMTYEAIRTTSVGTGGTGATPVLFDTTDPALPAGVTARIKPAGGAASGDTLLYVNGSTEETVAFPSVAAMINLIPTGPMVRPIVLRENQGLKVDQTTSSNVGTVNILAIFTVQ